MKNDARQSNASLIAFLAVMAGLLVLASYMVAPYVVAIIMGGILSILCQSSYRWFLRLGLKPRLAATLVTIGLIVLVIGPFLGFTALAVKQAVGVGQRLAASEISVDQLIARVTSWAPVQILIDNPEELEHATRNAVQTIGENASGFVLQLAGSIPAAMLQFVLAALACFFFLVDGAAAVNWLASKFPLDLEIRTRLQGAFKDTAISVVWASMAAAGAQSLVMLLAFVVLRVPAGFFAAGATFILAWIPLVGTAPVWMAGAIYLFVNGAPAKVIAMAAFGFLTSIVDNFVRPWVLRGRGEMHPLVSLVAIFGGIHLFGVVGVFFGPIIAAVVITVLQVWPIVGRRFGMQFPGGVETPREAAAAGSQVIMPPHRD